VHRYPSSEPVVITCALTGGIHGKEANPNLPEQPAEIVEQGVAAWRAGAAILHVHARNPDGSNTMDAGLLNFFIRGEQVFFANHRSDIERFAREIAERDIRPELEVYSAAMLEEVAHLLGLGIFEPPYVVNFVLHTPTQGGARGTPYNLHDMVLRLRELPVAWEDLRVNVSSMGPTQLPMTTIAMAMGFNVRVGMEDNVLYRRGEPLHDNAQLVERAVRIAAELDRRPASPEEARELLALRGRKYAAVSS
jgi:3-keto-5-aminohexanoate cleavage enzyme